MLGLGQDLTNQVNATRTRLNVPSQVQSNISFVKSYGHSTVSNNSASNIKHHGVDL